MADQEHIAGSITSQDALDFTHDTRLGIEGPLPSPNTRHRMREKLIGQRFELVSGK